MLELLLTGEIARFWLENSISIPGCGLALFFGFLILAKAGKGTNGLILKGVVSTAAIATIPLTVQQVGLSMAIHDMYAVTYCSILGTIVAIMVGFPFLFLKSKAPSLISRSLKLSNSTSSKDVQKDSDLDANSKLKYDESFSTNTGKINIKTSNGEEKSININQPKRTMTIGRSADNDIVIDDPKISRHHARLINNGNGFAIEDAGSTNGVMVDERKVSHSSLNNDSVVKIGSTQFRIPDITSSAVANSANKSSVNNIAPKIVANSDKQPVMTMVREKPVVGNTTWLTIQTGVQQGKRFELDGDLKSIGRSSSNDINVSDSSVSRAHAVVKNQDGKYVIFDNGSSSGTLVNDEKIGGLKLKTNETLSIGETELVLLPVKLQQEKENVALTSGNTSYVESKNPDAMIFVSKGTDAGKSFKLIEGKNSIGRGDDNTVSINDPTVSRQHCVIVKKQDEYEVFELGSQSGTYANSASVSGRCLDSGDVVTIGKIQMVLTSIGLGN